MKKFSVMKNSAYVLIFFIVVDKSQSLGALCSDEDENSRGQGLAVMPVYKHPLPLFVVICLDLAISGMSQPVLFS